MCDFIAEIFAPDRTSGRVWRFIFYAAMLAIFLGGLYYAIQSGAFDQA